jgi:predicted secreted hydrolase
MTARHGGIGARAARVTPATGRRLVALIAIATLVTGCTGGSPILANPPAVRSVPAVAPTPTPRPPDPQPIVFPRDDAPHDRLTEWWYYTGHLVDESGRHYGFEDVIFRAERGGFPVSWASHLALTDESGHRFLYAQRTEIGPQVDLAGTVRPAPSGFDLALTGIDPTRPSRAPGSPWQMARADATDRLWATAAPNEVHAGPPSLATQRPPTRVGFGLDLTLTGNRPPVLHGGAGWIDFGAAGGSYYYSRTRLSAAGSIVLDGTTHRVTGEAWFDHQWGDFIAVGGGGWDWFAVNLDDGTDLTLSLVRNADGSYPLVYGTLVPGIGGAPVHLPAGDFTVTVTGHWTSPATGAVYPAGWTIDIPGRDLRIELRPTVAGQELDTRPTTGVVYWEGSQVVTATGPRPIGGQAYVELTGYAPAAGR